MRVTIFIGMANLLLTTLTYFYYRYHLPIGKSWLFFICYFLLASTTVISRLLPNTTPYSVTYITSWIGGLWMAFTYYSLLLALGHLLLCGLGKLFYWQLPSLKIAVGGLLLISCFVAWGSLRAFQPEVRTEQITTSKLSANSSYRIVLLTDVHLGRLLGRSYAEKLVTQINGLRPDLVLIAGDLLDEKISYVLQDDSLSPLANLQAPMGVYLAYGNHDYLDQPKIWQKMVEQTNITVLRDKDIIVDEKLKLTGLNDYSHNRTMTTLVQLSVDNDKYYSILLDHQPRKMEAAAAAGYDLYLSGHTHTGQLFPNRLITKKMYALDYGRFDTGSFTAITSNGYGFWGTPVRTEVAPELVVIEVSGKSR